MGGSFVGIGLEARRDAAAFDLSTGALTGWNPNPNGWVSSLAVSGATVYAVGIFTAIGGQARNLIAALDATTGAATSWNPDADGTVNAVAVGGGSTVYAGGTFTHIGGQARSSVAALDATSGNATGWNPQPNSFVDALAVSGATVYVGGYFTSIGGQALGHIAAVQDSPTPTFLARFEAHATSAGVELRWQFEQPGRVVAILLERSGTPHGPWTTLAPESSPASDATEALDPAVAAGATYYYRLTAHLTDGSRVTFGPISAATLLAAEASGLTRISPNPAFGGTRIEFVVARTEEVRISVVDVSGREAAVLARGPMAPGSYSMIWDGHNGNARLPAGVYFVRWESPERTMTRRLVVVW